MSIVRRVFVEKKEAFAISADHLFHAIKGYLSITSVKRVRIFVRYDIENLSENDYNKALNTIFAEPPVDSVFETLLPTTEGATIFAYEYLPGQYDQRADSAVQCIGMISQESLNVIVKTAIVVVLYGNIELDDITSIKKYLINPVDSREASMDIPLSLADNGFDPPDIEIIDGFIDLPIDALRKLRQKLALAMSEADLSFCQRYFHDSEKRDPSLTEIRMLDTYWSDHCRHTTFLTQLTSVTIDNTPAMQPVKKAYDDYLSAKKELGRKNNPTSLMDIALAGMRLLKKRGLAPDIEDTHEVNACSIVVPAIIDGKTEEWLVMFKNETHNHPTEIEPFGGAATCLGGAIRDPLSGRSFVYQAMRVTGSGDPRKQLSETVKGKLPQRKITVEAAHGYSSYGNQIGLATGIVSEIYHEGYVAKRMEIGAVIAAAPKANVVRGIPEAGDVVVLVGGRTGRDGCGGATGSSKEHTTESIAKCGAEVQKGNPPTERKIQRLFRNPRVSRLIKVCNDFGAGGVSVAIGELADGLSIDLDKIPKKYEGLDGTELAISESQERMAVLLSPESVALFIEEAAKENLEAVSVARVTNEKRVVMYWRGAKIVDISRDFINTNGVLQSIDVFASSPANNSYFSTLQIASLASDPIEKAWIDNIKSIDNCSRKGLVERFDSTIGAASVLLPFGGLYQDTPAEVMAAKLPVIKGETDTATLMSYGFDPYLSQWSPFHGAIYAVVHSVAKIVSAGGDYKTIRLTLQEYFEKLGSDKTKWGKPLCALLGAFSAQTALGIPAIGGKDSMSGTFENISVPPTLVSFAVSVANAASIISPEFKSSGNKVVLYAIKRDCAEMPDFNELKKMYSKIKELIDSGAILSAYTIGTGGIAAAVSYMCFGNRIGFSFSAPIENRKLFSPDYGSIVAEISSSSQVDSDALVLGETTIEKSIKINGAAINLESIYKAWSSPLESVFPTTPENGSKPNSTLINFTVKTAKKTIAESTAAPLVVIPVFPGTNCEYDSARAFKKAGARVETVIIRNITPSAISESLSLLSSTIDKAQIIMIPGGFSAGDEPDGSGKFITAVFRNSLVSDSTMNLLTKRDGLILGICNGFQALIKLGLVPFGEIRSMESDSPTLTFNTIGRHISKVAYTRIASNLSPWLAGVKVGEVHAIPVSHGEGRFYAPETTVRLLAQNGQIATQYSDPFGGLTDDNYNVNGSVYNIEGISSPDGRVFGKMGHSERTGPNVLKNIAGNKDQKIFESGVGYFL